MPPETQNVPAGHSTDPKAVLHSPLGISASWGGLSNYLGSEWNPEQYLHWRPHAGPGSSGRECLHSLGPQDSGGTSCAQISTPCVGGPGSPAGFSLKFAQVLRERALKQGRCAPGTRCQGAGGWVRRLPGRQSGTPVQAPSRSGL